MLEALQAGIAGEPAIAQSVTDPESRSEFRLQSRCGPAVRSPPGASGSVGCSVGVSSWRWHMTPLNVSGNGHKEMAGMPSARGTNHRDTGSK